MYPAIDPPTTDLSLFNTPYNTNAERQVIGAILVNQVGLFMMLYMNSAATPALDPERVGFSPVRVLAVPAAAPAPKIVQKLIIP